LSRANIVSRGTAFKLGIDSSLLTLVFPAQISQCFSPIEPAFLRRTGRSVTARKPTREMFLESPVSEGGADRRWEWEPEQSPPYPETDCGSWCRGPWF